MFDELAKKLDTALGRLRQRGVLTEPMIREGLREVRRVLLEADVNYKVTRDFLNRVQERAIGEQVLKSVSPGQQIVKIVHDELANLMGEAVPEMTWSLTPPTVILIVGLQGSGEDNIRGQAGASAGAGRPAAHARGVRPLPAGGGGAIADAGYADWDSSARG